MKSGLRRAVIITGLGAGAGAIAATVGYAFRKPEALTANVKVDDMTLSDQLWAIIALALLGALVCGSIAFAVSVRKSPHRAMLAAVIAAPLGAIGCWGSRWLMDQLIYVMIGGPEKSVDAVQASVGALVPFIVWQVSVALALTIPIVLAIGISRFTFIRGLIGAGLVILFGQGFGLLVGIVVAAFMFSSVGGGTHGNQDSTVYAQVADVAYLFAMGAGAGLAFAVAEAIYKPAWLTSRYGMTEGRNWTLAGAVARIGSFEGNEVYIPPDGTVAPVHAQIHAEEDAHYIVDLVGGTLVNGQPVQSQWLNDGDTVGIGSARLLYRTRLDSSVKKSEAPRATAATVAPVTASAPAVGFVLVDQMGNRHVLNQGTNTIGRDASCDIALTWEPSVSRRHAEVTVSPNGVFIVDLGSTNGTFVGGTKVSRPEPFVPGTVVTFGKASVTLEHSK